MTHPTNNSSAPRRMAFGGLLFHAGAQTLIVQSALAREFLTLFPGSEASLGVFYASWLIWIGIGAALWPALPRRLAPARLLPLVPALLPLAGMAAMAFLTGAGASGSIAPGELPPFAHLAWVTFLTAAFVGLPAGLAFPAACAAGNRDSSDVARLFGCEALGGFTGGLIYTFVLLGRIPAEGVFCLLSAIGFLHSAFWLALRQPMGRIAWVGGGFLLAAGALWPVAAPAGRETLRQRQRGRFEARHPGYIWLATRDSRYERLELAGRADQTVVFANGQPAVALPDRSGAARLAALAACQVTGGPRRVLLLGSGQFDLEEALARFPSVETIDTVTIDPTLDDLLHETLNGAKTGSTERATPVMRHYADPRAWLRARPAADLYDLVLVLTGDPVSASANRFYTREFFETVRAHLSERGVLATGVAAAANYLGREVGEYTGAVVRTVRSVFQHVALTPGDRIGIFAGAPSVSADAGELTRRYRALGTISPAFAPESFDTLLPKRDVAALLKRFASIDAPIDTDARPTAYYLGAIVWSRFSDSPLLRHALESARRAGLWAILGPLAALLLARIGYVRSEGHALSSTALDRFNAVATIGVLGATGMATSLTILLAYQCAVGNLYGRIALLSSLFMFGLGAGGLAPRGAFLPPATARRALAATVLVLAIGLSAGGALATRGIAIASTWIFLPLPAMAGFLAGLAFAFAAMAYRDLPGPTGAWLDAADHAGGALGALLTGTILLPLLGFGATAHVCAAALGGLALLHAQTMLLARRGEEGRIPISKDTLRRGGWLLAAVVAAGWLVGHGSHPSENATPATLRETQLPPAPPGARWSLRTSPFTHWALAGRDAPVRVIFATDRTAADVRGFAGPIVLAIDLDRERLRGVRLLKSRETPYYVRGLPAWLEGFAGRPANQPIRLGRDIDSLTGATVTSRAVVDIVNRSLYEAGRGILDLPLDAAEWGRPTWTRRLLEPAPVALSVAFLLFIPVYRWGNAWVRRLFLVLMAGGIGFGFNRQLALQDIARATLGEMPTVNHAAGAVLLAGATICACLWGAAYCGYLCPFGALQEAAAWLGGRDRRRFVVSEGPRAWRGLRYVLLALALTAVFASGEVGRWIDWDILQSAFLARKSALAWSVIALFLVASMAQPRFWCLYLCPAGAALSLFNRFALLRKSALFRVPRYDRCDLGATAGRPRDCLRCNRCLDLAAQPLPMPRAHRRRIALLLIVALAVLFVLYLESKPTRAPEFRRLESGAVGAPDRSRARDIDRHALDSALRTGRLSTREAMHYRSAPEGDTGGRAGGEKAAETP